MTTQKIMRFNSAGTVGVNGVDFITFAQMKTFVNGLDLLALDQYVTIQVTGTLTWPEAELIGPATSDSTRRVALKPEPGTGVNDLNRSVFTAGGSGATISYVRNAYSSGVKSGLDIYGFRFLITGAGPASFCTAVRTEASDYDNIFQYNRFYDTSTTTGSSLTVGANNGRIKFTDNLVVVDGPANKEVCRDMSGNGTLFGCNHFVALGAAANTASAMNLDYTGQTVDNNLFLNFASCISSSNAAIRTTNNFANVAPSSGRTAGITVVTGANALVVDGAADWRPKASGPLIGAADSSAIRTLDILGNNRGPNPDAGAWQLNPAVPLPGGTITAMTVNGTTVTISGTTHDAPTSAQARLVPTNTGYNGAVEQEASALTLGSGTFTATFSNVRVGQYSPTVTLTNSGGPGTATSTVGNIDVMGAYGTFGTQVLDGQVLTITGTTSGNPTSGSILVPSATTNPAGASMAGPVAVTLGAGTFSATISLGPGNYDAPVVRFTTSAGTSLPLTGTSPVSIIGISGNSEAPPAPTAPARTASVSLVSVDGVAIAAGASLRFAWFDQVTPDSFDAPTDKGSVAIGAGGMVRVPLTHSMKASGEAGWLTVTDSDGSPDTVHKAFSGPVKVD